MGKKMRNAGVNSKAQDSRDRKAAEKAASRSKAAKAKEDAQWADEGDKKQQKAEARRREAEKKAAEAEAKRKELRELKAKEEAEVARIKKAKDAASNAQSGKKTRHEIEQMREREAREAARAKEREQSAVFHDAVPLDELANRNREAAAARAEGHVDASGLDAAVSELSVSGGAGTSASPAGPVRVNYKALYAAFEEVTIAELRREQPGLRLSQYKERCFKLWQSSPENPKNQAQ